VSPYQDEFQGFNRDGSGGDALRDTSAESH
jgi:hypothetical protein